MNKSKSRNNPRIPTTLPEEIITDILVRLPAKTLIRFKCICKTWLSLISNPWFIDTHLAKSSSNLHDYTHLSVIMMPLCSHALYSCSLRSLLDSPSDNNNHNTSIVELEYPSRDPSRFISFLGSSDGLLCILKNDGVIVYNPCSRKSKVLPHPCLEPQDWNFLGGGFGRDWLNDDYKVVWSGGISRSVDVYDVEVRVYSLRTGLWKNIEDLPTNLPIHAMGTYVNGAIHWAVRQIDGDRFSIVSLDLSNETYLDFTHPNVCDRRALDLSLGDSQGCLLALRNFRIRADVWVMKEYGVEDSWVKLYTITFRHPYVDHYREYSPLYIFKTGEILLKFLVGLVIYNPNDCTLRNPKIHKFTDLTRCYIHVESLVSPCINDEL